MQRSLLHGAWGAIAANCEARVRSWMSQGLRAEVCMYDRQLLLFVIVASEVKDNQLCCCRSQILFTVIMS